MTDTTAAAATTAPALATTAPALDATGSALDATGSALDATARARLAVLSDLMIPAADGMPSASAAGVAGVGVDHVLRVRPDLAEPLRAALTLAGDKALDLGAVRDDPALFGALAEVVAGAYYLDPAVAAAIGYHGRAAIPVDSDPSDADPHAPNAVALRRPVVERGSIYREDPRWTP